MSGRRGSTIAAGASVVVGVALVAASLGFAAGPREAADLKKPVRKRVMKTEFLESDVALPKEIVERARVNHELFVRAHASDVDLCAFVVDSLALVEPLERAFSHATESADWSDKGPGEYEALADGASAWQWTEFGVSGVRWDKVASVASPTAKALLTATNELDGMNNWGVWSDPISDFGGCHKPEAALLPLSHLVRPWREAPACLRGVLKPHLVAKLTEMAEDTCFCVAETEKATLAKRLAANARILDELRDIGPPIARKLRAALSRSDVRFQCHPG
jgi:hypothetical protein